MPICEINKSQLLYLWNWYINLKKKSSPIENLLFYLIFSYIYLILCSFDEFIKIIRVFEIPHLSS